MTKVITSIQAWRELRYSSNNLNRSIGFVPTMGALHAGHESLLKRARDENDISVLSIFVNPNQFNDANDLKHYPRTFEADLAKARACEVDYLLLPHENEIYADHFQYQITEQNLSQLLCGKSRPGHFTGVLTVVMKLLQWVKPHRAYFGEKDYQQYLLVKRLAEAFFLDVAIIPCPTIRDPDGVALSSRNQLLSAEQRLLAAQFARILKAGNTAEQVTVELQACGIEIDYIEERMERRFAAVRIGDVRLIDNISL